MAERHDIRRPQKPGFLPGTHALVTRWFPRRAAAAHDSTIGRRQHIREGKPCPRPCPTVRELAYRHVDAPGAIVRVTARRQMRHVGSGAPTGRRRQQAHPAEATPLSPASRRRWWCSLGSGSRPSPVDASSRAPARLSWGHRGGSSTRRLPEIRVLAARPDAQGEKLPDVSTEVPLRTVHPGQESIHAGFIEQRGAAVEKHLAGPLAQRPREPGSQRNGEASLSARQNRLGQDIPHGMAQNPFRRPVVQLVRRSADRSRSRRARGPAGALVASSETAMLILSTFVRMSSTKYVRWSLRSAAPGVPSLLNNCSSAYGAA